MKSSSYNMLLDLEEDNSMLYNTLTRKYILFDISKKALLKQLLGDINKGEYSFEEFDILKKLIQKGMVIKDQDNELEKLEYIDKSVRYNQDILYIVIQPTLDCNFRCTYCYEEHKKLVMDDVTAESIIKYVENNISKYKCLHLVWFGGEPLLEMDRIEGITKRIKDICNKANARLSGSMTTNGYLFNDYFIEKVEEFNIKKIQITVDGEEKLHDKTRPHVDGSGTYAQVMSNLYKLLDKDVSINLRINVTEENLDGLADLLDSIPLSKRNKVKINISNLFKTSEIINTFDIYKDAISKGYNYQGKSNLFYHCEVCKSGFTVEPNGRVVPCSMAAEHGYYYGNLSEEGELSIKNAALYYRIKNASAFQNINCKDCKELPICMGGCKFARSLKADVCNGGCSDGLSIEDKIYLHYYYDAKHELIKKEDYI